MGNNTFFSTLILTSQSREVFVGNAYFPEKILPFYYKQPSRKKSLSLVVADSSKLDKPQEEVDARLNLHLKISWFR